MRDNLVEMHLRNCQTALLYRTNNIYGLGLHKPKSLLTVLFNTSACFCGAIAFIIWACNGTIQLWGSFLILAIVFWGLYKDITHYMIKSYEMLFTFMNQIEDGALCCKGKFLYVDDKKLENVYYSVKRGETNRFEGYIGSFSGCYRFKLYVRG